MQGIYRAYYTVLGTSIAFAISVAIIVSQYVPYGKSVWTSAIWFVALATLAELLAVGHSESRGTSILASSPVYWVSCCVLGPFPAMIVCASAALVASSVIYICGIISRYFECDINQLTALAVSGHLPLKKRLRYKWISVVKSIGDAWYERRIIEHLCAIILHMATTSIGIGLSGVVYQELGGRFLINSRLIADPLFSFILPFICLVAVDITIEHGQYIIMMTAVDPVPGSKGFYAFWLRAKLALIEDVIPVWKGELFLVVVAILLAYLYASIRIWGFILAIMPLISLRDFFHQLVMERDTYVNTITTLATYMQHYHPYTRGHLKRVADLSERLAREMKLSAESVRYISTAGLLHDIGKVGVSEEILDKTSKLSDEEWETIKAHPVKGAEIISHLEFLDGIVDWIKYHHKWHNGAGYPATNGNGSNIPVEAAIIAAADAFDAMTDDRELSLDWKCDSCGYKPEAEERPEKCPVCGAEKRRTYREPKTLDQAIDELRRGAGTQFHPGVVKAFLTMVERDGIRLNV